MCANKNENRIYAAPAVKGSRVYIGSTSFRWVNWGNTLLVCLYMQGV